MARLGQFPGHANNGLPAKRRCGGSLNLRLSMRIRISSLLRSRAKRQISFGRRSEGAMKAPKKGSRPRSGRKPAQESRATEFRRKLMEWKQTPKSSRPSLRALARELGTSHQLLTFYLKGFEEWQGKEYWRQAREIRAHAIAEGRPLTQWEEQQARAYDQAGVRLVTGHMLRNQIERMKKDSERRPLVWQEIKVLKILAPGFPEARELLQKCSQNSAKDQRNNLPVSASGAAKSFRRA
jgi:hypothetical protein